MSKTSRHRRQRRHSIRTQRAGLAPGSGGFDGLPDDTPVTAHAIDFTAEAASQHDFTTLGDVAAFAHDQSITWVNVDGLHDTDAISAMCTRFSIHPLWIEDILNPTCRPKSELLDGQVLVVSRLIQLDGDGSVDVEQVSLVAGSGWVLTFQERPGDVWDNLRKRIDAGTGRVRSMASDYLLHALLDAVVDHYFLVLEGFEGQVDAVEDRAVEQSTADLPVDFLRIKQDLTTLRQSIWPMREALGALLRAEGPPMTAATAVFYRDLYDHIVQVMDILDATRDRLTSVVELNLSLQGQRLNEIMKVLTLVTSVFIPLSFLTGLYGMNFVWMPERDIWWAYPVLLAFMLVVAIGMGVWFRTRKWL